MAEQVMRTATPPPPAQRTPTIYDPLGLRGDPFPPDPLAGTYVPLPAQEAVLAGILGWLDQPSGAASGIGLVAAGAGLGKTRLLDQLVARLADEDRLIGVIPDTGSRRSDAQLLRAALEAFGGTAAGRTGLELTTALRTLLASHVTDVREPVLLVDNAALSGSQLEILRNVLGPDADGVRPRVQVVLLGPPELADRIARRRSLAGTVRHSATLAPLDADAMRSLIEGRVDGARVPGSTRRRVLEPDAITAIWQLASGNPGAALQLARAALLDALAVRETIVAEARVRTVAAGGDGEAPDWGDSATDDTVLQTRLVLPGLDEAPRGNQGTRRRGRQQ